MRKPRDQIFGEFGRVIDEFFDELLIDKWRCGGALQFEQAEVIDREDHYEIRMVAVGVDPETIEVEGLGRRLTVRAAAAQGRIIERTLNLTQTIDPEAAIARWSVNTLTITLPKQKPRRIQLKES